MKIGVQLPMTIIVAAAMALTGTAGIQIADPWAHGSQATAYHADQYRAMGGAVRNGGYKAGAPADYPGDGSDNVGSSDSGGGGAGG
jgi:hypothetical protein